MREKLIVITGPTATGKTRMGVELALRLGGEVVSADSMQIYADMDIGTAKPTLEEMRGVPHHMIGTVSPFEDYSVSRYVEDATRCVEDILARGRLPIVVGGTGLYIDALLAGRSFAAAPGDDGLREKLGEEYDALGGEKMLERLRVFDPQSAGRLHANDKKRIIRAIEIYTLTGKTLTEHDEETKTIPPRFDSLRIALSFENREDLYRRIDLRVEEMYRLGLGEEVLRLMERGVPVRSTAMQAIGYKEIVLAVLAGGKPEDAMEKIQMESRRYAKRQLSWLRRDEKLKWILWGEKPDFPEGLRISTKYLEENGI